MPRTKRVTAARTNITEKDTTDQQYNKQKKNILRKLDAIERSTLEKLHNDRQELLFMIEKYITEEKVKIGSLLPKTVAEVNAARSKLSTFDPSSILNSISSSLTSTSTKSNSGTLRRSRRTKSKDEGYSESRTNSSSRERPNKPATTATKNPRRSRSCTNKPIPKSFITPNNKIPQTFGYITPKVKPNTPQAILRRPDVGEMAFSLQGSPLLATEGQQRHANVNLPINGRILSLQPVKDLRMSQVPAVDKDTMEDLMILRYNLDKVIELSNRHANRAK